MRHLYRESSYELASDPWNLVSLVVQAVNTPVIAMKFLKGFQNGSNTHSHPQAGTNTQQPK